ncbi:MAG: orotidine 5'-phosphate decarboxylase [Planctomycetes bacterium]|nr:orotidine 5'-phosphate decarboxylase [Planctomycetota bacterium]
MSLDQPVLQVALDLSETARALNISRLAVDGGADWIEAGTPLIKSEGLDAVRSLRRQHPDKTVVADLKTMDAGRAEVEMAAKAGASVAMVMGLASDSTIRECVEAGGHFGCSIGVDLLNVPDPARRAREVASMGVHHVGVHLSIDDQMSGRSPFDVLASVVESVDIPVAVAGGINSETAPRAVQLGASIIIVGGAVTKAVDPKAAAQTIKNAMLSGRSVASDLFRRRTGEDILNALQQVSAANLSDALHRGGVIDGIRPVAPGLRMCGRAFTVRTAPGDWAKPVEAIDMASPGDVIAIDAGGVPPAVWGELASNSSMQKGIAGVLVNGAVRDSGDIARLGFPAFSTHVCPNAGEPKGFGETAVTIAVAGREIRPGDFLLGDDDGVVVLPGEIATEYANRAMDVLEKENRLREEILQGSTLGRVMELLRWEKNRG